MKILMEIDEPSEKLCAVGIEEKVRAIMTSAALFTSEISKESIKCHLLIETSKGRVDFYSENFDTSKVANIEPIGGLVESQSINSLSLSGRTFHALSKVTKGKTGEKVRRQNGISELLPEIITIGNLIQWSAEELNKIPGFGTQSLRDIRRELRYYKLHLRGEEHAN